MKWDVDKEDDVNEPREEVKRVKKAIEGMDVKAVRPGKVSLNAEENGVRGQDLNFRRQVKRRVNDYKYKAFYNIGKTKRPYVFTRNSVVMMIEEELGVEILVKGSYKPEELNGDTDDEDALVYEISAETPEILQEAMAGLPSAINAIPPFPWNSSSIIGRYIYRNGARHRLHRVIIDNELAEKKINEIRKDIETTSVDKSVEISIRGRFSGYIEPCFGEESNGPTYIQIVAKTKREIKEAKNMCVKIIDKHREDFRNDCSTSLQTDESRKMI
ncbi:hypothetical protein EROM_080750 [Encephalitozoon romaleae SJ-2008]|uniref:K Homology domain-containing protein n=1 Tax=Encephalitozoon romaleae (strain SJ-2008) TaxID=1178016 RepID=I7ANX3_ENCRO|nr:hypothetical protein EROM_080750 [Encephalitozoon romaleae SJ-2008]AFN83494.1 hypothetical protein EROM_080750 [Encephalitozoon romaleae SJ-2008]